MFGVELDVNVDFDIVHWWFLTTEKYFLTQDQVFVFQDMI